MSYKIFKNLLSAISVVIITVNISTSQITQQWVSSYNGPTNGAEIPVAMTTDNIGNIYVTGISTASGTGQDFATVKYNPSGDELWVARYNNPNGQGDEVRGIAVDGSGNVYVTGSVSYGGSNGVLITVKYNSDGIEQWAKQLGEPVASPAAPGRGKSPVTTDASGNIYVGGSRKFGSGQNSSYVLIKYNSDGDSIWTKTYKGTHFLAGLGSGIVCVKVSGDFVYVTGKSFDQNPDLSTSTFVTTIKYDLLGALEWIVKDTLINGSDDVVGMAVEGSGNTIVTCNYGFDIRTYKYNSAGAKLWQKTYAGIGGTDYDEVTGISLDPSGNIYLTGTSARSTAGNSEDFMTLKYDVSGNLLWEKFFDGTRHEGDYAKDIAVDPEGNAYITGIVFDTGFDFNYMTVKYGTDGTQLWNIKYDGGFGNRSDNAVSITLDQADNVIVTGYSSRGTNNDDYSTVKYSQTTGISQISSQAPSGYTLMQNYPNPFNPVTNLNIGIPESGYAKLTVFSSLGKEVATLFNGIIQPGVYKFEFDASGLTSGIYFYRLETDRYSSTKKMTLIK